MIGNGRLSSSLSYRGEARKQARGSPTDSRRSIKRFQRIYCYYCFAKEMKAQGVIKDWLELLKGVRGAFRPGVLTALTHLMLSISSLVALNGSLLDGDHIHM